MPSSFGLIKVLEMSPERTLDFREVLIRMIMMMMMMMVICLVL